MKKAELIVNCSFVNLSLSIAVIWFIMSLFITLRYVAISDPSVDPSQKVTRLNGYSYYEKTNGSNNESNISSVSLWFRCSYSVITFPMRYLQNWDNPQSKNTGFSFLTYGLLGIFLNSIFWGCILALIILRLTRFLLNSTRN